MNRRSRFRRSGLLVSAVGALVVGAFFATPAPAGYAGTSCSDCYIVTPVAPPAPVTAAAGTGQQYAFQVTDNDPNERLVSLTFSAPADFVITTASGPGGTSVSTLPAPSVTLNLPSSAGSTFTVELTALAPCVAASSEVWGVSGVDSLGETNEVQWSSSPLSVPVTGECSLAFTGQPAQTAVSSDILTGFNSTGDPLPVQLDDANGDALNPADFSASGIPVTVSIQANPGGGTLSGTTTVDSSKGVADFGNLQIDQTGVGYDLVASAPDFTTSKPSSLFTVTGVIKTCGASCSASQSTETTATSFTTTSASGDFAALGLGGVSFACNHYTAVSDTATFGIFNSSGGGIASASATATLTLSAAAVASSPRPLIFWQVCYAAPTSFPVVPGTGGTTTIAGVTYYTGLLLPCFLFSPGHPEPCLISQRKDKTGAVTLTFIAFGDPYIRG